MQKSSISTGSSSTASSSKILQPNKSNIIKSKTSTTTFLNTSTTTTNSAAAAAKSAANHNNNNNNSSNAKDLETSLEIEEISKKISEHADALYRTWKSHGLAPTEILDFYTVEAAAAAGATSDEMKTAEGLQKLVSSFVTKDKEQRGVKSVPSLGTAAATPTAATTSTKTGKTLTGVVKSAAADNKKSATTGVTAFNTTNQLKKSSAATRSKSPSTAATTRQQPSLIATTTNHDMPPGVGTSNDLVDGKIQSKITKIKKENKNKLNNNASSSSSLQTTTNHATTPTAISTNPLDMQVNFDINLDLNLDLNLVQTLTQQQTQNLQKIKELLKEQQQPKPHGTNATTTSICNIGNLTNNNSSKSSNNNNNFTSQLQQPEQLEQAKEKTLLKVKKSSGKQSNDTINREQSRAPAADIVEEVPVKKKIGNKLKTSEQMAPPAATGNNEKHDLNLNAATTKTKTNSFAKNQKETSKTELPNAKIAAAATEASQKSPTTTTTNVNNGKKRMQTAAATKTNQLATPTPTPTPPNITEINNRATAIDPTRKLIRNQLNNGDVSLETLLAKELSDIESDADTAKKQQQITKLSSSSNSAQHQHQKSASNLAESTNKIAKTGKLKAGKLQQQEFDESTSDLAERSSLERLTGPTTTTTTAAPTTPPPQAPNNNNNSNNVIPPVTATANAATTKTKSLKSSKSCEINKNMDQETSASDSSNMPTLTKIKATTRPLTNGQEKTAVKSPFLTRGSVAERVLMFEKCPDVRNAFLNIKRPDKDAPPKSLLKVKLHSTPPPPPSEQNSLQKEIRNTRSVYIPRFYFPHGKPQPTIALERTLRNILGAFDTFPNNQVTKDELPRILKLCGLPFYWRMPVMVFCQQNNSGLVERQRFVEFWKQMNVYCHDNASRFVYILSRGQRQRSYILPEDFAPMVQDVVDTHPGLAFLKEATEFHSRYVHTVIARIFYNVNRSWSGRITIAELKKSDLLQIISLLEEEDDINQIMAFFSYEHFYVIYCKFWELDKDHDLLINQDDLARHSDHALSTRIVERIFSGCVTRNDNKKHPDDEPKMSYTDFVWFVLSEEDKRTPTAIEYWFRCMDIDGDGVLSMYELEYFYEEQQQRMESIGIESLPFEDCLCQMLDMIKPKNRDAVSLSDLKRCKMTHVFFDTFFNLEKYLDHEQKDPFASQRDEYPSDWDRFAAQEYELLITEE